MLRPAKRRPATRETGSSECRCMVISLFAGEWVSRVPSLWGQGSASGRGDGRGEGGGDFIPDDPDLADRDLGVEHQAGRGGLRPRDEPLQGHVDAIAHHVEEVDLAGTGVAAEVNGDIAGDDDLDVARRHPYPGLHR